MCFSEEEEKKQGKDNDEDDEKKKQAADMFSESDMFSENYSVSITQIKEQVTGLIVQILSILSASNSASHAQK